MLRFFACSCAGIWLILTTACSGTSAGNNVGEPGSPGVGGSDVAGGDAAASTATGAGGVASSGAAGGATSTGGATGSDGSGGAGPGSGGSGSTTDGGFPTSCSDIGNEPTIPPACATVSATKTATNGVLASESPLDTSAIQAAIDACPAGHSVKLEASGAMNAFSSGPIELKSGVTLWIDTGVTLFGSRNPRDYDPKPNQCAQAGGGGSCRALIDASGVVGAGVAGEGAIDGRGGEPVIGDTMTWWDLEKADAGKLAAPRLVQVSKSQSFTLYKITMRNSPKFHTVIDSTNGFVVWGITIKTPPTSPNTDGIDPAGSTNGVIAFSKISTGDDNVALKGSGPIDNIIVAHNHFGAGHGMSIGSETYGGVKNVKVCDLSLDGTSNGLRIKSDSSRGGVVQGISYTDICMRKVANPLVFDPFYSSATGTEIPDFHDITVRNVHILGGGNSTLHGYDAAHPLTIAFDNVVFDDNVKSMFDSGDARIQLGPGPVSFTPAGTNVTVTRNITTMDAPRACDSAWVTF